MKKYKIKTTKQDDIIYIPVNKRIIDDFAKAYNDKTYISIPYYRIIKKKYADNKRAVKTGY